MSGKKDPRTKKFLYDYTEPENAVNIAMRKLEKSELKADSIICDNLTLQELMIALMSAADFIDFAKFECGNDFGK